MIADRRSMQRFALDFPILIECKKQNQGLLKKEFITSNISAGGAYITTENPLPVGTEVDIDLPWPPEQMKRSDYKERLIKLTGEVIRTSPQGMAIMFSSEFQINSQN